MSATTLRFAFRPAGRCSLMLLGAALLAAAWLLAPTPALAADSAPNGCVDCHSNPNFRVTHPKLYDYYQNWKVSAHDAAGVTCVDCHGGDPTAKSKTVAHEGAALSGVSSSSPLNYRNIPRTCARCHDDIYEHYRKSDHYRALEAAGDAQVAPNCVTCHGSVNISVLSVNNVKPFCGTCHNQKTGNHPGVPDEAQDVLNNFLSIQRYYRGIAMREDPKKLREFFTRVDRQINRLTSEWHTFDLDAIKAQTQKLMLMVKEKRQEVMERSKQ